MIDERHRGNHWKATKRVVFVLISFFMALILILPVFYIQLSRFSIFGFPMGYFLFGIAGLVIMAGLLFWMAVKQDKIDRKYGASENI